MCFPVFLHCIQCIHCIDTHSLYRYRDVIEKLNKKNYFLSNSACYSRLLLVVNVA